jgi:hypothetical protein
LFQDFFEISLSLLDLFINLIGFDQILLDLGMGLFYLLVGSLYYFLDFSVDIDHFIESLFDLHVFLFVSLELLLVFYVDPLFIQVIFVHQL